MKKRERAQDKSKRAKLSYEIAGVYYADIGKVKSKAKTILHLKQDGEKVTGKDEDFLKEIIAFHEKKEQKMRDFESFVVGQHPNYDKTRCFFV